MSINSSIPAVVTAVLSTLTSALAGQVSSAGSPVPVVDGEVGTNVADEYVQIIGVSSGQQVWGSLGRKQRNETYDVIGTIRVYVGNDDQAYCRTRCFALWALVEVALNNDPTVGAVVNGGTVAGSVTALRMGVTDLGGRAAEIDFSLAVFTRLVYP